MNECIYLFENWDLSLLYTQWFLLYSIYWQQMCTLPFIEFSTLYSICITSLVLLPLNWMNIKFYVPYRFSYFSYLCVLCIVPRWIVWYAQSVQYKKKFNFLNSLSPKKFCDLKMWTHYSGAFFILFVFEIWCDFSLFIYNIQKEIKRIDLFGEKSTIQYELRVLFHFVE